VTWDFLDSFFQQLDDRESAYLEVFEHLDREHAETLHNSLDLTCAPWSQVARSNRLISHLSSLRKQWVASLSYTHLVSVQEACSQLDSLLFPNSRDFDPLIVADSFASLPCANAILPSVSDLENRFSDATIPIVLEYVDGYAMVFCKSASTVNWSVLTVAGNNFFEYENPNISLQDEISDFLDISPGYVKDNAIVFSSKIEFQNVHKHPVGLLKVHAAEIDRYQLINPVGRGIHIDLTMDMLSIGFAVREKMMWRHFSGWSLRNWIENVLGPCGQEIEKTAKRVLISNNPESSYFPDGGSRQILPKDLKFNEYINTVSAVIPDTAEKIVFSGWIDTKLGKNSVVEVFSKIGIKAETVFGSGPNLSLWKYNLTGV
jgi:hypothetical protein